MQTIAEQSFASATSAQEVGPFPPFSLARLLRTVFAPHTDERVAILIDLPDPHRMKDYAFLADPKLTIQKIAHDTFQQGLKNGVLAELGLSGGEMYAYQITGGSNLDPARPRGGCRGARTEPGARHLSELRPDSLHLDVLGDRAADCLCQTIRLSWSNAARGESDHPRVGAGGGL